MYRKRMQKEDGNWVFPFSDDEPLHSEDIDPSWIFVPYKTPMEELFRNQRIDPKSYAWAATRSKRLAEMYTKGSFIVPVESPEEGLQNIGKFMTLDLTHAVGMLEAVDKNGIYIRLLNSIYPRSIPVVKEYLSTTTCGMRYFYNRENGAIDRIIGWIIYPSEEKGDISWDSLRT